MVASVPPGTTFAQGLLVTHDGDEEPEDEAANFKFTRWQDLAVPRGLKVGSTHGNPPQLSRFSGAGGRRAARADMPPGRLFVR
jgi:hypothetical protein